MAKIDPKQRMEERKAEGHSEVPSEGSGGPPYVNVACKAPGAVVGFDRVVSKEKRTPGIEIRFMILDGTQAGHVVHRTFWESSAFNGQIADLALAIGCEEPFDPEEDEDLEKVLTHKGGIVGVDARAKDPWVNDKGDEIIGYEARFFYRVQAEKRPKKDQDPDRFAKWKDLKLKGIESWEGYLKWKAERAAKAKAGGSGGRRSNKNDDDMPF